MLQLKLKDMEAKELMIGDWVKATYTEIDNNENEHKCYTYCKVSSIGDDGTFVGTDKCFSVQVFDDVDVESLEEAKPIPLTKEILEKNGFEDNGYMTYSVDANKFLEFYLYEKRLRLIWCGIDEWQNHSKVRDIVFECNSINYVHEFQHALRLCGLNDLADNFQV